MCNRLLMLLILIGGTQLSGATHGQESALEYLAEAEEAIFGGNVDDVGESITDVEVTELHALRLEAAKLRIQSIREAERQAYELRRFKTWFKYGILVALLIAMLLTMYGAKWIFARRSEFTMRDALNIFGLILIIYSIVFVVIVAETQNQLATAVGVLGTIAGYLFSAFQIRQQSNKGEKTPPRTVPPPNGP